MPCAALLTLLRGTAGSEFALDGSLLTSLDVALFTSVGLSADARALAPSGRTLLSFFVMVAGGLLVQDAIGASMSMWFGPNPVNGLLAGSITPSGGHGTGAAWAGKFFAERNLHAAAEPAVASATSGLVTGGVVGCPMAGSMAIGLALFGWIGAAHITLPSFIAPLLGVCRAFPSTPSGWRLRQLEGPLQETPTA